MANFYLILRSNLTGMGGAHMYVRNKAIYKMSKGFFVCIISSTKGNIVIHDLQKYQEFILPELALSPRSFGTRARNSILSKALDFVGLKNKEDNLFIESNDTVMALWGELLAEKTNGKHFCFILNENFSPEEKWHYNFWMFKLKRGELAGIQKGILAKLFNNSSVDVLSEQCYLPAFCSNVVDDCTNPFVDKIDKKCKSVGSIGRLNKYYVPYLCKELQILARNHSDVEWQFVFIGGSPDTNDKQFVEEEFKDMINVHVLVTGYMFPIPRRLVESIDIFASCAGSVRATYAEKAKTVSIDGDTGLAIGIMGYDTMHTLRSGKEDHPYPINVALEKALFEDIEIIYDDSKRISMDVFEKEHDTLMEKADKEKEYYPIDKDKYSKREIFFRIANILLGEKIVSDKIFPYLKSRKSKPNSRKA